MRTVELISRPMILVRKTDSVPSGKKTLFECFADFRDGRIFESRQCGNLSVVKSKKVHWSSIVRRPSADQVKRDLPPSLGYD